MGNEYGTTGTTGAEKTKQYRLRPSTVLTLKDLFARVTHGNNFTVDGAVAWAIGELVARDQETK